MDGLNKVVVRGLGLGSVLLPADVPLAVTGIGIVFMMARLFRAKTLLSGEPPSVGRLRGKPLTS